ncbi:GIY-YIG nuclease family protein [Burkholderia pseudomallei]|uniref:GIY-YIG nuclease family protein n=3 Tax=Burkholderia pseudomallei TaxID=28450 RepID=UPI00103861A3|nr:GIY-YIG nuclease family protein [Burkholderia pseudomallei]
MTSFSPLEAILSSFNWSENSRAGQIDMIHVKSSNKGILEITADGWDGRVLKMTRRTFQQYGSGLNRPAVYVLYVDHFDKATYGRELYVGHTSAADGRLTQHDATKDFWTLVLVFTSYEDWMNTAYTQNLEHSFIRWAKEANRYEVKNANDGAPTHLGADDKARLRAFESGVRDVLKLAGVDVFEWNRDGVYTLESPSRNQKTLTSSIRIEDFSPPKIRILRGSEIALARLDEKQVEILSNVIVDAERGAYIFEEDAVIDVQGIDIIPKILGVHVSLWKNESGISARDALREFSGT